MYTKPLSCLLRKAEDIKHHLHADDKEVHNSFNTSSFDNSIHNLQNSLVSVQDWMYENKLKLNPDNTEFLLIGIKRHREDFLPSFPIDILGNNISPTPSARNLGVIFDEVFSFDSRIEIREVSSLSSHLLQFYNHF